MYAIPPGNNLYMCTCSRTHLSLINKCVIVLCICSNSQVIACDKVSCNLTVTCIAMCTRFAKCTANHKDNTDIHFSQGTLLVPV